MAKVGFTGFFIFAIFGTLYSFSIASSLSFINYSETESLYSSEKIENMQDNRDVNGEVSGNLFYTKGQENTEYYYYFMKWENDTIVPDKIKASDTKLKYIADGEPRIDTYVYYEDTETEYSDEEIFWLTYPSIVDPVIEEKQTKEKSYKIAHYELYIPKNSVSHEYNIDLQ
ncbi:MAG: hypothetical protein U0M12_07895 [Acutalibacteraceae bacterium]|nr:hypothetical protein [Acutalibacteraceae bacterium]